MDIILCFTCVKFWHICNGFLYLKIIIFSNEGHFIEEHQTGINILNKVPYQSFH